MRLFPRVVVCGIISVLGVAAWVTVVDSDKCAHGPLGLGFSDAKEIGKTETFEPDKGGLAAVRAILKSQSLPANLIVRASNVNAAQAFIKNGKRYIFYNKDWIAGLKHSQAVTFFLAVSSGKPPPAGI